MTTVLVADIGGTNARFAWMSTRGGRLELLEERTLASRNFPSFADAAAAFLDQVPAAAESSAACFGIAGPVRHGRCEATNLPWVIDADELRRELGLPCVTLLNDVEAAAWGLSQLAGQSVREVEPDRAETAGNRALLAPGTGLGQAMLIWDGCRHAPTATEGGHAGFGPTDELEVDLWRYLHRRHAFVSWERVLSGPGLVSVFRFLCDRDGAREPDWLTETVAEGDPATISARAHDEREPLCRASLDLFFSLLGNEAGNLALRTMAVGGVYLAGGIVAKLFDELVASSFLRSFSSKGRFRGLLEGIPVRVVVDERLALWGAAARIAGTDGNAASRI